VIVLDTNVLSELMRQKPDVTVQRWFASLVINECMITVVTAAELRYGAERLPSGRRQEQLKRAINGIIEEDFSGRVLPYTVAATVLLADLTLVRERLGRPISLADAQIAAICKLHGAALATRNTRDFENCGIELINPWSG